MRKDLILQEPCRNLAFSSYPSKSPGLKIFVATPPGELWAQVGMYSAQSWASKGVTAH